MESIKTKLSSNPREKASILSILTFWWTIDLFKLGYGKTLEVEDLYQPITADYSESLGDRLERKWKAQISGPGRPSLLKAVILTFWREYAFLGVITIINDFFIRISQPLLLGRLLLYFRKDSDMTHEQAIYCGLGIIGLSALSAITINQFILDSFHCGMKVRVAVCSIIYRKSLRLSRTAIGDTAPGKIVNLLSNDVNRFDIVTVFLHSMWSAPLITLIIGYFLWLEAGWAGMVGTIVVFFVVPIQSYTGKLSSKFRLQTAWRTDERVRFMDEVISGVQVIKMYAWEKPFSKLIKQARKMELKIVKKSSYVRGLYMTFMLFTTRAAMFSTMMTLALMKEPITPSKIFVIAAYYGLISGLMSQMFVRGVAEIAEVLVALRRLQNFLMYSEKENETVQNEKEKQLNEFTNGDANEKQKLLSTETIPSNVAVSIKNADARWVLKEVQGGDRKKDAYKANDLKKLTKKNKSKGIETITELEETSQLTLKNLSINFKKGILIGVVGPVGSGKSSLLQAILKELPLENGSVTVRGSLSYACQEPWVFAGTVQQNIIFGQEKEQTRYDEVVKACALLPDFEQFPHGDKSLIGERGASLSGGQKARINLARAVYRRANTYLLDDPLSAVDAHVGRHLFDSVIGPTGRLAKQHATRILVTHQVHYLNEADWIVVLKDGKVEFQGTPFELTKSGIDIAELLDVPEETKNIEDKESISAKRSRTNSRSSNAASKMSLHSLIEDVDTNEEEIDENDRKKSISAPIAELEKTSKGTVKGSPLGNYMKAGAHPIFVFLLFVLFVATQIIASMADIWVSYWTSQEEARSSFVKIKQNSSTIYDDLTNSTTQFNNTVFDFNATNIADSFNNTFINKTDTQITDENDLLSTTTCLYIHAGLIASLLIVAIVRSLGFYTICVISSQKLHDMMFHGIISTTMRFFDTNPSGRILNRFSKDMGSVDELLPKAILDASQILLSIFGAIIVTLYVTPWMIIPLGALGIIFMFTRRIYLKSSKNIKRVEGITRSPVFSHLAATLTGLSTIRAFDAQDILIQEFDTHQDLHSGAWYMFITASSAFGFALDMLCLIFIFMVVFSFLSFNTDILGDKVGLAVTQSLALTGMMQWGVRQSAEVANFMMSVERLLEYRDLEPEPQPIAPKEINKSWPFYGKLEFRNVKYRYALETEPVLRDLSFMILPKEKIGIVGRTGAGKSSLIGAIFRLAVVEGQILIDDIDTSTIHLQQLRSKVAIIPQDPVLFSGTLRRNLDPFEEYPDEALWSALSDVELNSIAANSPAGLQTSVMAGGSNYSVGQRQLLCLARAILRRNKILVLDEATANVDPKTDTLIQQTIRVKFAECTVLTVAHRLHTIMDSDRVLVMSVGRAEEFATPHELLQKPTGIFKEMVLATGPLESERLIRVAKETYELKKTK